MPLFWLAEAAITTAGVKGKPPAYLDALSEGLQALKDWVSQCNDLQSRPTGVIVPGMHPRKADEI
jgi:hypothetical protein